jgi:hypothetical protein
VLVVLLEYVRRVRGPWQARLLPKTAEFLTVAMNCVSGPTPMQNLWVCA